MDAALGRLAEAANAVGGKGVFSSEQHGSDSRAAD
jgi:hypothetical protein